MKQFIKNCKKLLLEYKWQITIFMLLAVACYVAIYLSFFSDGFIPTGNDLGKSDWLTFLGSYLSFIGTVAVSIIALTQSHYNNKKENKRRANERKENIQPIFSINIVGVNKAIDGVADVFNPYTGEGLDRHRNVKISIENVGYFPIKHFIIFNKYLYPLLKSCEIKTIQCAFHDSPDAKSHPDKVIVLTDDFNRTEGLPSDFNINYEDVDGHSMFQSFQLKQFDNTFYYALVATEEC